MKATPEREPDPKSTWWTELSGRASSALSRPWLGAALAVLAVALALPSAWSGRYLDDHYHRAVITGTSGFPGLPSTPARLFAFVSGDPDANRIAIERGQLPWWSSEKLRIAFFRPLAALTHWLDYALWPDRPFFMHLHSLLWLALVVLAASAFYRRLLVPPATGLPAFTAGLAASAFALDDAHAIPAGWLANRYVLPCLFFGLLTLMQHDRWRREGVRSAGWLSAICFGLALLCGELAVSTGGYLLAYAVFMDRGRWTDRLRSLSPYLALGAFWAVLYRTGGYGARGSAAYVDPVVDPLRFVAVAVERVPLLLAGQWWFPPSDFANFLSPPGFRTAWWIALALAVVAGWASWRASRGPAARFLALGMALSLLPVAAIYPSDRLLTFVGLGAMGLVALVLGAVLTGAERSLRMRAVALPLAVVHFLLAPLMTLLLSASLSQARVVEDRVTRSLPVDADLSRQRLLLVDAPDFYKIVMPLLASGLRGHPVPARALLLGTGIYSVRVTRTDERTLFVRPAAGFFPQRGAAPRGLRPPAFSDQYLSQLTNRLFRSDAEPLAVGQRIDLDGVVVEIVDLTKDGRPAAAAFRFDRSLEDPSYRWLRWEDGRFVPFTPPPVGDTVTLASSLDTGAGSR